MGVEVEEEKRPTEAAEHTDDIKTQIFGGEAKQEKYTVEYKVGEATGHHQQKILIGH